MNPGKPTAAELSDWLVNRIASLTERESQSVAVDRRFFEFGMSSRDAATIAGELETWLGLSLPPTLLWDYPTIQELAEVLAIAAREGHLPED